MYRIDMIKRSGDGEQKGTLKHCGEKLTGSDMLLEHCKNSTNTHITEQFYK